MKEKKKLKGSLLVESAVAIALMGIISVSLMPMVPQVAQTAESAKVYTKMAIIADYVGNYLFRWAAYPPDKKPLPFSYYLSSEGKGFDITGDKRINSLPWTQALMTKGEFIQDEYKVSITFWETATRTQSAVVKVVVWYDKNLDGILDVSERRVSFSTMLSESQTL